mmetsp:Transcript_89577/g.187131  ORF Transcript_89577/g.187131 Transcript_89577/m.187131 type:complete len:98 (-) Transcript_89577:771-1064(-)
MALSESEFESESVAPFAMDHLDCHAKGHRHRHRSLGEAQAQPQAAAKAAIAAAAAASRGWNFRIPCGRDPAPALVVSRASSDVPCMENSPKTSRRLR